MLPFHGVGFWDSLTNLFPNTVHCNALEYHQFTMAYDKLSFVVCISTLGDKFFFVDEWWCVSMCCIDCIWKYGSIRIIICCSSFKFIYIYIYIYNAFYLPYKCVVSCYQLFWVITKEFDIDNCKIFVAIYLFKIYISYMNSRCNYKDIFIVIGLFDGGSNLLCMYIFSKNVLY